MLFNSFEFLIFFITVTSLYFCIAHQYRWFLLLLSSCVFYCFFIPKYIFILFLTIVIDYFAGVWIENAVGRNRKFALIISLITNIGILAVFKYYNFFITNINNGFHLFNANIEFPLWNIILPIGLSFHTFQAMSYTIEVYRGNQKAEKHFGIYALYVMFYPQLVAGPIERPQNVLHQFYEKHSFDYQKVTSGLKLMAWGLFKKSVIGDNLTPMVDKVYSNPTEYENFPLIIGTVFFAFQIFCDFSGYSDMALGAAKVMGFDLMKNFNRPYFSKSISEFWRRWHISLSTWFRDYLYFPLGGNRVNYVRQLFNLFFVFLISGLWHGASWNFVIWGGIHGILLVLAQLRQRFLPKFVLSIKTFWGKAIHILIVFILVDISWIFFRATTFSDAKYIIENLFSNINLNKLHDSEYIRKNILLGQSKQIFVFSIGCIVIMEIVHFLQSRHSISALISQLPNSLRWSIYTIFIFIIIVFGVYDTPVKFIYFQF